MHLLLVLFRIYDTGIHCITFFFSCVLSAVSRILLLGGDVRWIKRFILFHNKTHPAELGKEEKGYLLREGAAGSFIGHGHRNLQALSRAIPGSGLRPGACCPTRTGRTSGRSSVGIQSLNRVLDRHKFGYGAESHEAFPSACQTIRDRQVGLYSATKPHGSCNLWGFKLNGAKGDGSIALALDYYFLLCLQTRILFLYGR